MIDFIAGKLNEAKNDLLIENEIIVADEQAFVKIKKYDPGNIYVVVKTLASTVAYDGKITPIQLMVLSEANSLNIAQNLMNKFVANNNLESARIGNDLVKQSYNTPVVVSNFNNVTYGFNSLLYVSGTFYILNNIIDLQDLMIDGNPIDVSSFNFSYSMSGNTQPISNRYISETVKSVSTFNISFVLPMIGKYKTLINKILTITNNSLSGNLSFIFSFKIGEISYNYNMKLIGATFTTAPNSAPGLQVGFMV